MVHATIGLDTDNAIKPGKWHVQFVHNLQKTMHNPQKHCT